MPDISKMLARLARGRSVCSLTIAVTVLTAGVSIAQQDDGARALTCELNRGLSGMDHVTGAGNAAGSPVLAVNAIKTYRCLALFDLVKEYAPAPELRDVGQKLMQANWTYLMLDMNATKAGAGAAAIDGHVGHHAEAAIRFFWLKHHATELAQGQNVRLATEGEPAEYVSVGAQCLALLGTIQSHVTASDQAEAFVAAAQTDTLLDNEGRNQLMDAARELLFGFSGPGDAAVADNQLVAARLAPVLKASLMQWREAGTPRPAFYGHDYLDLVTRSTDSLCGG
jgi:hypothetical protein